jgi:hypothetical protein
MFTVCGMADNETKKRLLLSKWRVEQEAGRENERECDCRVEDITRVLEDVRYWLHDGLVLHKLVSDPRRLLRKVEDVLR